jgi:hypothetical protein
MRALSRPQTVVFTVAWLAIGCGGRYLGGPPLHPSVAEFRRLVVRHQEAGNREMGRPPGDRTGIHGEVPVTEQWKRSIVSIKRAGTEAVLSVCGLLGDPDIVVAVKAAEALGEIGDPVAVPSLLDHLDSASHWGQFNVVEALGKIGDRRAVSPLAEFMVKSRNGDASCEAFHVLLEWQVPSTRDAIDEFLPSYPTILGSRRIELLKRLGCTKWKCDHPSPPRPSGWQ